MSTLKARKIQIGKDIAENKNSVIGASQTPGLQAISIGTLENIIEEPIQFSQTEVILLDPKAKQSPPLGDVSKRFTTTEWIVNRFGSGDVFADFTTTGNINLSSLDLQPNGDWDRVLNEDDVILVKDNIDASQNGWYNPREFAWVRIETKNITAEFSNNILTRVSNGKSLSSSLWILSTLITTSFVLNTTNLNFKNISSSSGPGGLIDIKDVVGGYNSILFLTNDGYVYEAHGNNSHFNYNSGRGQTNAYNVWGVDKASVVPIRSSSPAVDIHMGGGSSYVLLDNGELWAWGLNDYGQLGLGHSIFTPRPELSTTNVSKIIKLKVKGYGSLLNWILIQKTDGYVYACGYNGYGQFGLNDTLNKSVWTRLDHIGQNPLSVYPIGGVGSLIYQKPDLTIWACGYNATGQLGDGTTTQRNTPVNVSSNWKLNNNMIIKKVTGGNGWTTTASDSSTYIAMLLDDGTTTDVRCSGYNGNNNLGDGTTTQRNTPVRPTVGTGRVKDIVAGPDGIGSMYVLKENGDLFCWGYNGYGQLGDGTTTQRSVPTLTNTNVLKLIQELHSYTYGHYHTAFIIKADGLYGTGYGNQGHGGWGIDSANRSSWTRVNLPLNVDSNKIKMMTRYDTTSNGKIHCLVTTDNVVWSWGYNGQYGITYNYNGDVPSPLITNIFRGH